MEAGREYFSVPPIIDQGKFFDMLKGEAAEDVVVKRLLASISEYATDEAARIAEVEKELEQNSADLVAQNKAIRAARVELNRIRRRRESLQRMTRFRRNPIKNKRIRINRRIATLRRELIHRILRGAVLKVAGPETAETPTLEVRPGHDGDRSGDSLKSKG